jgi:regulation of enolase protein 1 (concanavalin A-like superfamily)
MLDQCKWYNEPAQWNLSATGLAVTTDRATDFWRKTHYGFVRHSGHLFGHTTSGGFTASVRVRADYKSLYDQAGIMVRVDDENWVKAGVEMSDGETMLSSVVTVGCSDWATSVFRGDASDFWIRTTVNDGVLRIQVSVDGRRWPLVRLCPFPRSARYVVGPMCCTPEREGLSVLFSDFTVEQPNQKDLHDLT